MNAPRNYPDFLIIITIILVLTPLVTADAVPIYNPQTQPTPSDTNALIIQEGIKTRTEITSYADKKITEMVATVKTDGQKFIDDNFKVLDKRMHELALKVQIQFLIGLFCVILFANAIWFFIARLITRKDKDRPRYLTLDTHTAKQYGLISSEYEAKINAEDKTIFKKVVTTEDKPSATPPSMNEIEAMINRMKEEKLAFQQQKNAKELEKKLKEDAKKQEAIDKELLKLKMKEEKKTKRIREKQKQLEEQKKKLIIPIESDPFFAPPIPPKEFNGELNGR